MMLAQLVEEEGMWLCCGAFLGIFLLIFWVVEFLSLMGQPDEAFPGRYDKAIWAAVLLTLNVVGALLYWMWKQGGTARALAEQDVKQTLKHAGLDLDENKN